MKNSQNTFTAFLEMLNVKHTKVFSNQYFNVNPYNYNLLGLSKLLFFEIENTKFIITNIWQIGKNDLEI